MIKFLVLAVCMAGSALCFSQDSLNMGKIDDLIPGHTIKISPFHLFGFYPTVQLAYEIRIAPQWTLQFDGGVVVDVGFANEDFKDKRGFKLKLEPRYYFFLNQRRNLAFYSAAEFYLNDVDFGRTSEEIECFDPNCLNRFMRIYTYRMNYQEFGLALKAGMVKYFGAFMFDVSTGFAIRNINYSAPPYINVDQMEVNWYDVPRVEDRVALSPVLNFRLGYHFP